MDGALPFMDCAPVEMDTLFERGRKASVEEGWVPVEATESQAMGIFLSRRELSKDVALLRAQYEVGHPFDVAWALAQPEVYFNAQRPPSDLTVACGVEKVITPGDAIAWVQTQMTPVMQRTASLIGTASLMDMLSSITLRIRHSVRRDWPADGLITVAVSPLQPDSDITLEEWGVLKSTVAIMQAHETDPGRTKVTEVKQLVRVPLWAVPMAAPMHFKTQLDSISEYMTSDTFKQAIEDLGRYIVIGIRRCVKGPPLLPREACAASGLEVGSGWVEAEIDGVRLGLAEYLTIFLKRIGIDDVAFYDMLHGRQIVRYQAVVLQRDWERAWAILEPCFRTQRASYRRLHGGANAPDLTIDMVPKLLAHSLEDKDSDPMVDDCDGCSSSLPFARTFIHISQSTTCSGMARIQNRRGSDPARLEINNDMAIEALDLASLVAA